MNDLIFFSVATPEEDKRFNFFFAHQSPGGRVVLRYAITKIQQKQIDVREGKRRSEKTQFLGTKNLSVISEQNAKASRGWPIDVLSAFGGHQHIAKDCNILTSEFIYIIRGRYSVEDWGSCTARKVTSNGNFFQSYHNYIEFLIIYSVMDIFQ